MVKGIILILAMVLIAGCNQGPGAYDGFAQCLTDNGAVMYGTEWCPHCQAQKSLFESSFDLVNYVDCDKQRDLCEAAGVNGYPTWVIDGNSYPGTQQLSKLATLTSCELE